MRRFTPLAAFFRGLTEATSLSAAGAIVFAFVELCAFCAFLTPPRVATLSNQFFKVKESDDYARITVDALKMRSHAARGLEVAYLGTSVARLALRDTDSPDRIAGDLARAVDEPVTFWNLTANNEQPEEYLILLDYVPRGYRGAIVAMVSDSRHGHAEHVDGRRRARTKERLGLDAPSLGEEAEELGEAQDAHTGIYFVDHLGFFAARREFGVRLGDGPGRDAAPDGKRTPESWWRDFERQLQRRPPDEPLLTHQLDLIERFARELRRRQVPLVLLEGPVNPRYDAMKAAWRQDYFARMTALAERTGAPYWDISEEARLTELDFYDAFHIGSNEARGRYQSVLVERLASFLRERAPKRGAERD